MHSYRIEKSWVRRGCCVKVLKFKSDKANSGIKSKKKADVVTTSFNSALGWQGGRKIQERKE